MDDALYKLTMDPVFLAGMGLLSGNQVSTRPGDPFGSAMRNMMQGARLKSSVDRNKQYDKMQELNMRLAQARLQKLQQGPEDPAAVREWGHFVNLPPAQQEQYLRMKRGMSPVNLGDRYVVPSQVDPTLMAAEYQKGLAPENTPEVRGAQERAVQAAQIGAVVPKANQEAIGLGITAPAAADAAAQKVTAESEAKATAEEANRLADIKASMPKLESVVSKLKGLGEKATYTYAGQAMDFLGRQVGMDPSEGAVARAEYEATVDNEVLPLMRQTFGSQFTAEEGERLRAILGDENLSPPEKNAQLRAFIDSKYREVGALELRTGGAGESSVSSPDSDAPLSADEKALLQQLREELGQ